MLAFAHISVHTWKKVHVQAFETSSLWKFLNPRTWVQTTKLTCLNCKHKLIVFPILSHTEIFELPALSITYFGTHTHMFKLPTQSIPSCYSATHSNVWTVKICLFSTKANCFQLKNQKIKIEKHKLNSTQLQLRVESSWCFPPSYNQTTNSNNDILRIKYVCP